MPSTAEVPSIPHAKKFLAGGIGAILTVSGIALAENQNNQRVEAVAVSSSPREAALGSCAVESALPTIPGIKPCQETSTNPFKGLPTTTSTSTTSTTEQPRSQSQRVSRSAPRRQIAYPPPATTSPPVAATQDDWVAPEGCMRPMGPTDPKSMQEAHFCWDDLIAQYAWPQREAFAVMYCESKGNPHADNPTSTASGLYQILGGPKDPRANVSLAYNMYSSRHWGPWTSCPWRQYL